MNSRNRLLKAISRAWWGVLLIGCTVGVRAAEAPPENQPAAIEDAQAQGDKALQRGDMNAALLAYTRALSVVPADSNQALKLQDKAATAAVRLEQKPPVPDEAKDLMARGKAFVSEAKGIQDYARAAEAMNKALAHAPWWAAGYFNAALAEEAAGKSDAASRHLKIYLRLKPEADDKEKVRAKIALLEVRAERGAISWVTIPGGAFTMGDDEWKWTKPRHSVTVRTFQMAKTPATFGQYKECVAAGACTPAHVSDGTCATPGSIKRGEGNLPDSFQGDDQPVVCVDWDQAAAFAKWAGGRLPTDTEWEYAARSGGKEQRYPWGNEEPTCSLAVIKGCASATAPVCSKTAGNTSQGLCDMAGNVREWVQDWYHDSYKGAPTDGSAWEDTGSSRVVRGGSWNFDAGVARSAFRDGRAPGCRDGGPPCRFGYLGFRLAR